MAIWLASWFDFRKPHLNVTLSDAPPVGSEEYEKLQKHRAQRDRKALRFILRSQWNLGGFWGGGNFWKELLVLVDFYCIFSFAYINARWWFEPSFMFIHTWGNDPIWLVYLNTQPSRVYFVEH